MRSPAASLALALWLLASPAALAAPLTPAAAADRAVAASPAIRALDQAIEAAEARAQVAGAWPNPALMSQVQVSTNSDANMLTFGLRQPLDFRNLAGQRRAHAREDAEALRLTRERTALAIRHEARRTLLRLQLAELGLGHHDRHIAHLEAELAREKKKVEAGGLAPHELLHLEYELASARQARQVARHGADRERARLNFAWGEAPGAPVAVPRYAPAPVAPLAPLASYMEEATKRRFEMREAAVALRREQRAVRLAESLRFGEGEIDLQAGTTANTDPTLYGQFAMPVPLWNTHGADVAAASAEAARQAAEQAAVAQAIAQEVADAYMAAQQARERLAETEKVLVPLAAHALEKAEARVRAGADTPQALTSARKQALDADFARIQALLERDMAQLRLEEATGR